MKRQIIFLLVTFLFASIALGTATAANRTTDRLNISNSGEEGNGGSWASAINSNGNYIVFYSYANNLVEEDTNGRCDVFVYDISSNFTERISVSSNGEEGNDDSYGDSISPDGRYVVFESYASNLVTDDNNNCLDVFIRDRILNITERVSISSWGEEGNDDSCGGYTRGCLISADGRYVVFSSLANNLVPGDNNGLRDVFVRDRTLGITKRVSISSTGGEGNRGGLGGSISADGHYIVFWSRSKNLVLNDVNGCDDVFVYDLITNTIELVSIAINGTQGNLGSSWATISPDGRYVTFSSYANNLVEDDNNFSSDIFLRDRLLGITERLSVSNNGEEANSDSYEPSISNDGQYIAFWSSATNLVSNDLNRNDDIFVYDQVLKTIERVSISKTGEEPNSGCYNSSISGDGNYIIFDSYSDNLIPYDTNGVSDVFIYGEDNVPPIITGTVTPNLVKSGNVVNIIAYADSDTESVTAEVLGEKLNLIKQLDGSWSANYTIPMVSDGIYDILLTANDNSGNKGIANINFRVDDTPPILYYSEITPNLVKSGDLAIIRTSAELETENITAEVLGETFNLVKTSYNSWSANYIILEVLDGIYSIKLTGFDVLGNQRTVYISFRVDNTAPTITATINPNLIKSGDYVIISAFADSDTESMTAEILDQKYDLYKLCDGSWSTDYIYPQALSGIYPFKFTATDQVGNKGIFMVNLGIDNTPPTITAKTEPNPVMYKEKIKIIAESSPDTVSACAIVDTLLGPQYVELQYSDGFWIGEYVVTPFIFPGQNNMRLVAYDRVKNMGTGMASYNIILESSNPASNVNSPTSSGRSNSERSLGSNSGELSPGGSNEKNTSNDTDVRTDYLKYLLQYLLIIDDIVTIIFLICLAACLIWALYTVIFVVGGLGIFGGLFVIFCVALFLLAIGIVIYFTIRPYIQKLLENL